MFDSNISALTCSQVGDDLLTSETASWFFDPLPVDGYDLVVIDPPWPFATWSPAGQGKSPSKHYCTIPLADIMALPVRAPLKDDAVVYLRATGAMLEGAHEVMAAWGITYKTELVWRKVTTAGKVRWGCGYWARSMHEPARQKREGWDCWGDEVEKFSSASGIMSASKQAGVRP